MKRVVLRIVLSLAVGLAFVSMVEAQRKKPEQTTRRTNADIAVLADHLLRRHLANYPNGKSPIEQRFARNLDRLAVKSSFVSRFSTRVASRAAFARSSVNNPTTRTLKVQTPTPGNTLGSLLGIRPNITLPPKQEHRYRIRLQAIKSVQCADDIGGEVPCDKEEPFIAWTCFAPGYLKAGVTESAVGMGYLSEWNFREGTDVLSLGGAATRISEPVVFVYQVIEDDPNPPTAEDVQDAIATLAALTEAIVSGDVPWDKADEVWDALTDLYYSVDNSRDDDLFPTNIAIFTSSDLWNMTSGVGGRSVGSPLFESAGDYSGISVRIDSVADHWKVAYLVTRE